MKWFFGALKKLLSRPVLSLVFISNLALGLSGLLIVLCFKQSISESLGASSRELLGGDLVVRSRRVLTDEEKKTLQEQLPAHERSDSLSFVSMVASPSRSAKLTVIRAIDGAYPLYGEMVLKEQGAMSPKLMTSLQDEPVVWVQPEFLTQMDLQVGDSVRIGNMSFRIADVVEQDNAQAAGATSFAPVVTMSWQQVEETGLVQFGSTVRYRSFYRIQDPAVELASLVTGLKEVLDPTIRLQSHEATDSQTGRLIRYLSDYLGLVGLVALFLANIGAAFLFRGFLFGQSHDLAIMRTLGVSPKTLPWYLYAQVFICGVTAVVLSSLITLALLPGIESITAELFPGELILSFAPSSFVLAFFIGVGFPLLMIHPFVRRLSLAKPAELFGDFNGSGWFREHRWYHYLALVSFVWGLAFWQSNSLSVGSLFTLALLGSALLIGFGFVGFVRQLPSRFSKGPLILRWIWTQVSRRSVASASLLLAIGLSVMLISLIPQIERNIAGELDTGNESELPGLFLFDIQDDQLAELTEFLDEQSIQLNLPSALVRGRIRTINGSEFEREDSQMISTRESERAARFRNRGVNLSYRSSLSSAETLLRGREFSGAYDIDSSQPAEISVERRYAERLDLELGDEIVFDVQGVDVPAQVVNFRHVKWTSFQPNFFIQFQPGVLEEAPKTFVASIAKRGEKETVTLINAIVDRFPNISVIDVHRVVARVLGLTQQMSFILQWMSLLCFICGLTVMFSVIFFQSGERRREVSLLKSLGVSTRQVRNTVLLEVFLIAVLAVVAGVVLSSALSYFFVTEVFKTGWHFDSTSMLQVAAATFGAALITGLIAITPALRAKPWALLK